MPEYFSQKVTAAEAPAGFLLRVTFADGFKSEIDLAHLPDAGAAFTPLHNPVLFAQAKANPEGAIEWPGPITLPARDLRAWCEAARILNGTETQQWINDHSQALSDKTGAPG